jgi:hypothetical protein
MVPFSTSTLPKHFCNCHPEDIVIIEQEGFLPQCPNCGIFKLLHTPHNIKTPKNARKAPSPRQKNFKKHYKQLQQISKVVKKDTNNNPHVMSVVYKTIVLSVLFYVAETWVTNTIIMNMLNSFHNSCARTISGKHIRLLQNGTWELGVPQ